MDLDLRGKGIGEEQLHESTPLVRALVVQRLELLWRTCEPQINRAEGKPDPRFVESAIRILDRLARLYRLDAPQPSTPEQEPEFGSKAELVAAQLRELEERDAQVL